MAVRGPVVQGPQVPDRGRWALWAGRRRVEWGNGPLLKARWTAGTRSVAPDRPTVPLVPCLAVGVRAAEAESVHLLGPHAEGHRSQPGAGRVTGYADARGVR
ncbi:hypothetical protein GCM10010094_66150 [Streptomyces flaveus]|uniref:Uncharacterized protein n=1 Tax=Streptomyces flaveus TaxID=66370 RepID=A0A917R8U5_9ACTN|nr:hypothetical protein GCM10010094_66150 [Streptomyces flaveus]